MFLKHTDYATMLLGVDMYNSKERAADIVKEAANLPAKDAPENTHRTGFVRTNQGLPIR